MDAKTHKLKVCIFNENCTRGGQVVSQDRLDQANHPDDARDWTTYEGTARELVHEADDLDGTTDGRRYSHYRCRVAASLREAAVWHAAVHAYCLADGCESRDHVCRECGLCVGHCQCDADDEEG